MNDLKINECNEHCFKKFDKNLIDLIKDYDYFLIDADIELLKKFNL